jgi:putative hydrolase of the HAD superfamily
MPPLRVPDSVRWVLFDAVGTLIYPHPPAAAVYHGVAARYGSALTAGEIGKRFSAALATSHGAEGATSEAHERRRWQQIVAAVIDDAPARTRDKIFDELWQHFARPTSWRVYLDVVETLAALCNRGFRLGIASNFDDRLHEVIKGHAGLQCFEQVLVSSALGYAKPDPRFFAMAQEILAAQPDEIALVGDDEIADIAAARAAGWHAIHIARP